MSRTYRAARWLASRPSVRAVGALGPERLLINFACALIGLGALISAGDGALAVWPAWFAVEWAAAMLLGGLAALYGIAVGGYARTSRVRDGARLAEWIGMVCIGVCALTVGVTLLVAFGWEAVRLAVLFLSIAVAKGLRLLLSYVAREELLRSADRDASPPAGRDGS